MVKETQPAKATGTVISAAIDVGFGNSLYLRGEGPGLSWDKGLVMDCVADDCWTLTLPESDKPIVFKFLLNDVAWSIGNDYIVASGSTAEFVPTF